MSWNFVIGENGRLREAKARIFRNVYSSCEIYDI